MTLVEILTIIAIVIGPPIGVGTARFLDNRRSRRERRMDIFRTLMRTRRTPMWADHVGALNLVEIEFAKDKQVIAAHRSLFEHLGKPLPRRPEEETNDNMPPEEKRERDRKFDDRMGLERHQLLSKLLHAMAKVLDFKIEQLEVFEGGYTPQGWGDIERQQEAIRRFAIDLYLGRAFVPVGVIDYRTPELPPPDAQITDETQDESSRLSTTPAESKTPVGR